MVKIEITKEINQSKLFDELLNSNLITATQVDGTSRLQGNILYLDNDADITTIQAVIDAHNPEPLPPIPTKTEILEQELANTNALILELTEIILGGT